MVGQKKDSLRNLAKFTEKHLVWSLSFDKVAGWKPETFRSSHWRCSVKQGAPKNFTGNHLCWSLFLIKLHFWGLQLYQRRVHYFPAKFAIILSQKSTCKLYLKRDSNIGVSPWILWIIQEHIFCRLSTSDWFWNTSRGFSLP